MNKELEKLFTIDATKIKQAGANAKYDDVQMYLNKDIDKNIIALAKLFEQ